ncbi:MAG TPA: SRPBCC family protein [Pirellulaceae bacterium]|nr:SRPBCC family protein [Pirellulaceae bacterium]
MAHGEVSQTIPASCEEVFDLLHDYERRLEWDSLLSEARLTGGHTRAGLGATSVCVGRRSLGGVALETEYVAFERPRLAAVKMINRPPLFASWAASIKHEPAAGGSRVAYTWTFTARPRWLAWLLEPILNRVFRRETRRRLAALAAHFAERRGCG